MEPGLLLIFVVFGGGIIAGVPVAFCLGIAAVVGFLWEGLNPAVAFQQMASGMSIFSLLAIPFFIFAGELMLHGGIARRLIAVASAAVGRMRGGLAQVNVGVVDAVRRHLGLGGRRHLGDRLDADPGDEAEGLRRRLRGRT